MSYFYDHNRSYPSQLEAEVAAAAGESREIGWEKNSRDKERPLLVSVRFMARAIPMPGMMDTILNLGMNDEVVEIVAKKTNNARFRHLIHIAGFLQMYDDVVMGVQNEQVKTMTVRAVIEHLKDERYGKA